MIAMYWGGHCGQTPPEATGVPLHSLTLTYNVTWLVKLRHMFVFLFLISNLNLTHFHTSVFIEKHGKQFLSPSSIDSWYFIWNLWHKIYKVKFSPYLRWELWRAPVIQLLGGLSRWMVWGRDPLLSGMPCRSGVRTKPGINMGILEESEVSRLSKEGRTGPGGKPSRQKSPCHAVVGSHPWVGPCWQPGWYNQTRFFSFFFFFPLFFLCYYYVFPFFSY